MSHNSIARMRAFERRIPHVIFDANEAIYSLTGTYSLPLVDQPRGWEMVQAIRMAGALKVVLKLMEGTEDFGFGILIDGRIGVFRKEGGHTFTAVMSDG